VDESFEIDTTSKVQRPKTTKKLWFGIGAIAIGTILIRVISTHASELVKPGNETISNIVGACFWAAILLALVGMGVLLSIRR
jgi:hypothetical protein